MKLIAKKPCSFGGKKFFIGEEIPAEIVLDPHAQEKMGVLAMVDEEEAAPGAVILIHAEEGDVEFRPTPEGLQAIFDVLTGKPDEAKAIIEGMTDGEALILLHMADSRKAVKAAAEARGKAISEDPENPEESAGEQ